MQSRSREKISLAIKREGISHSKSTKRQGMPVYILMDRSRRTQKHLRSWKSCISGWAKILLACWRIVFLLNHRFAFQIRLPGTVKNRRRRNLCAPRPGSEWHLPTISCQESVESLYRRSDWTKGQLLPRPNGCVILWSDGKGARLVLHPPIIAAGFCPYTATAARAVGAPVC